MEPTNLNTRPLVTLSGFEATTRLGQVVREAYMRRSRKLPDNINDIVATFKADILRYMPQVTVNQIDEAVTDWTLNRIDIPISPSFLFSAVKAGYIGPRRQQQETETRPDTERDTLSLLDTLAEKVAAQEKPFFNWRREHAYLVRRGQLAQDAYTALVEKARNNINTTRVRDFRRPLSDWSGQEGESADAMAMGLAVVEWLKACVTTGVKPSQALAHLVDEGDYIEFRRQNLNGK